MLKQHITIKNVIIFLCVLSVTVSVMSAYNASQKLADNPNDKAAQDDKYLSMGLVGMVIIMSTFSIASCDFYDSSQKTLGNSMYSVAAILSIATFIISCIRIKKDKINNVLLAIYIAIIFGLCSYKFSIANVDINGYRRPNSF